MVSPDLAISHAISQRANNKMRLTCIPLRSIYAGDFDVMFSIHVSQKEKK